LANISEPESKVGLVRLLTKKPDVKGFRRIPQGQSLLVVAESTIFDLDEAS
jgi:hypothetical protein